MNWGGKILIPGISSLFLLLINEIREIDVFGETIGTNCSGRVSSFVRSGFKGPTYQINGIVYFINGQGEIN